MKRILVSPLSRGLGHATRDLPRDVERARRMPGLAFHVDTEGNVRRLYDEVFAPILDTG